jgi:hypothetical protein
MIRDIFCSLQIIVFFFIKDFWEESALKIVLNFWDSNRRGGYRVIFIKFCNFGKSFDYLIILAQLWTKHINLRPFFFF